MTAFPSAVAVASPQIGGDSVVERTRLAPLMERTAGRRDLVIGLIDGPVAVDHPELERRGIRALPGLPAECGSEDPPCVHGTYVAGILAARRGGAAPGVCPGCTLAVRPIFGSSQQAMPEATPGELAAAICDCVEYGARILNVSAVLTAPRGDERGLLAQALELTARRGVLVVVAAGNQATVAGSMLTRHRWVLPVVAWSASGRPAASATLSRSIGARGLCAPADDVTSLAPGGGLRRLGGSSTAAPLVTGAAALTWSLVPGALAYEIRHALTAGGRRSSVVPPVLDAWGAYRRVARAQAGR